MPVPKLPLQLLGLSHAYHLAWWRLRVPQHAILTPWNARHNAIFVHIPKTAGTSILSALGAVPVVDTHAPAQIYAHADRAFYARAWKFAVVRDPWDRFASSFHFMKSGTDWPMQQEWARANIGDMDFAQFTHRVGRDPLYRARVIAERFFWPQTFWLGGVGTTAGVDTVFRFEELDAATRSICERLEITPPEATPHLRRADKPDFRTLYDPQMVAIVGRLYRRDIAALRYDMPG